MKKMLYLVPVVLLLAFTFLGNRMFSSGNIQPRTLVILMAILVAVLLIFRPKQKKSHSPASELESKVRGTFAKDAFADDAQKSGKFQSALKDFSGNMPKSALNKLNKLAPLCDTDPEKYAVAVATAMVLTSLNKYAEAARQYTSALVLCPDSNVSLEQGRCYQRIGELKKARSAYSYALDLDGTNLEARSALATACVADRDYETGLEEAKKVLEQNENHASSLATAAICCGLMNDPVMGKFYTDKAVANGYSANKIKDTIAALKQ